MRYHPYPAHQRAHFRIHHADHMQVSQGDADGGDKKRAKHEAQMIPGLGPLEWGFPNSIITTLRYCDFYGLTSTTGGSTAQVFRANGIFDPDYTGAGHQPMYRDNWANIYDYYTVLGSKITVTYHSRSSTQGFIIGCIGTDSPSITSTVTSWMENNNAVSGLLGNVNCQPVTLSMTYSPEENLGSNAKDDGSSMTAVGADPSSGEGQFYFAITAATEDGATTASLTAKVQIEYTVKFTYLSKQAQN